MVLFATIVGLFFAASIYTVALAPTAEEAAVAKQELTPLLMKEVLAGVKPPGGAVRSAAPVGGVRTAQPFS